MEIDFTVISTYRLRTLYLKPQSATGVPPEVSTEKWRGGDVTSSQTVWRGFHQAGTGGGRLKCTPFLTDLQAGTAAEGGKGGESGASRAGWSPLTGGKAAEMGSTEKAGFNLSKGTTSAR